MKKWFGALAITLSVASLIGTVQAQDLKSGDRGSSSVNTGSSSVNTKVRATGPQSIPPQGQELSDFKKIEGLTYLGKFRMGADKKLVKIGDSPAMFGTPTGWYDTNLEQTGSGYYSSGQVEGDEYVYHGTGISEGTTVTTLTLYWVSQQATAGTDVSFNVSFYNGRTNTATPNEHVMTLEFTFGDMPATLGGFFAEIELDAINQFDIAGAEFEYGYQLTSGAVGTPVFSTFLPTGIIGQAYDQASDTATGYEGTTGGISYNSWERWISGQHGLDVPGTLEGNYYYGNAEAVGPWGAAALGVNANSVVTPTFPESFVIHNDYTGDGENIDLAKVVHKGTGTATDLSLENLTDSAYGITGVGLDRDFASFPPVTLSDFQFHVSPQGAFGELTWTPAPAPTFTLQTGGGTDGKDRVIFTWPANTIQNRWLRVTVLFTEATGIPQEYLYVGHLVGEVTGLDGSTYTVSFADLAGIRAGAGATVDASSDLDVDKNGTVSFADISAARPGVGNQLSNISVP